MCNEPQKCYLQHHRLLWLSQNCTCWSGVWTGMRAHVKVGLQSNFWGRTGSWFVNHEGKILETSQTKASAAESSYAFKAVNPTSSPRFHNLTDVNTHPHQLNVVADLQIEFLYECLHLIITLQLQTVVKTWNNPLISSRRLRAALDPFFDLDVIKLLIQVWLGV